MKDRPAAIVTDGLWRKSLSAIRSLGKSGFDVTVMGDSVWTTGFWSRFCRRRVKAPTAALDAEGFGRALQAEIDRMHGQGRCPVLIPMEEATLDWITRNLSSFQDKVYLLVPPPESLAIARDKGLTQRAAREAGIPTPQTWEPATPEEFARQAAQLEAHSFVTKPRSGSSSIGVTYGEPRSDSDWVAHWSRFGPMIIQERIPAQGRGQGVSVLFDAQGRCLAAFAHERLQQYPNSGGPSTDRVSIDAPELLEHSLHLLRHLNWRGIAMVEWKVHPRDGKPRLMEINPRFWGSLELAVRSGMDFPALYARAAMREQVAPIEGYQTGVRCRWMMPGELLRYASQPRTDRESLSGFLRGLPSQAEEWDRQDLRGGLASIVCTGALALHPRYWKYLKRP